MCINIKIKHIYTLWSLQQCPKVDSIFSFLIFSFRLVTSFPCCKDPAGSEALKGTPTASGPSFFLTTALASAPLLCILLPERPWLLQGTQEGGRHSSCPKKWSLWLLLSFPEARAKLRLQPQPQLSQRGFLKLWDLHSASWCLFVLMISERKKEGGR